MNNMTHCSGCMERTEQVTKCPSCGYEAGSAPDNPLYLPQGYVLNDRYLIGKVIGIGGFGLVYIAWDNNLEIKVAVKEFLPKEYAARSSDHLSILPYTGSTNNEFAIGAEKFLDEAKALAKFQDHPGIVTVLESFKANNTVYMVMQLLDGMTLKEYLKRQPGEKIPFNLAVKTLMPIMDALKEVHKAGFVHRDISPDNIYITNQNQIKLLDFGAARYAIGEHSKSLTSVLKHGYAPVEQYSSKGNQGPWTDVYAVAATIYRAITGMTPPDSMDRIQEDSIQSPTQLGINISSDGEYALMRGLAIKASARFENIQAFQQALCAEENCNNSDPTIITGAAGSIPKVTIKQDISEAVSIPGVNSGGGKKIFMYLLCAIPILGLIAGLAIYKASSKINPTPLPVAEGSSSSTVKPEVANSISTSTSSRFDITESVVYDTSTGLMWTRDGDIAKKSMRWSEAEQWVKTIHIGGYTDWRLPTYNELESITKINGVRSYEWLHANNFISVQHNLAYWSSTVYEKNPSFAKVINMDVDDAKERVADKSEFFNVWPVRVGR